MARTAPPTKIKKPVTKDGRPKVTGSSTTRSGLATRSKTVKVAASRSAAPAAAQVAKVSKDELRAQVEKLQTANATLRAKARDATRTASTATARVGELEMQLARFERQIAKDKAVSPSAPLPSVSKGRRGPKRREIDPGDAVSPGVALEESEPSDGEA